MAFHDGIWHFIFSLSHLLLHYYRCYFITAFNILFCHLIFILSVDISLCRFVLGLRHGNGNGTDYPSVKKWKHSRKFELCAKVNMANRREENTNISR